MRFIDLVLPVEVNQARLAERTGHFMGPGMLASQLATLEPLAADEADGVEVPAAGSPGEVLSAALCRLSGEA